MLVMYTNYDPVATALGVCAERFLKAHGVRVTDHLGPGATEWQAPHDWLRLNPGIPLIFFGHGIKTPASFLTQSGAPFLDASATSLLNGRLICGFCCFSIGVGLHATAVGATLIGHPGFLDVVARPKYAGLLADCIMVGLELLVAGATAGAIVRETRHAYESMARKLYRGSALDCLVAPIFAGNAKSLTIVGDVQRRP